MGDAKYIAIGHQRDYADDPCANRLLIRGSMTLCPIALMATCNKCPAVGICPLKEVLGDYKPENPASAANAASIKDKTSN